MQTKSVGDLSQRRRDGVISASWPRTVLFDVYHRVYRCIHIIPPYEQNVEFNSALSEERRRRKKKNFKLSFSFRVARGRLILDMEQLWKSYAF
jgi:hypothetical protein